MLARDPEHRSAGHQQRHVWARIEEIAERSGGRQDLFKIVEHQEIVAVSQRGPEIVEYRAAIGPDAEGGGDGGQDERRLLDVRQIHELGGKGRRGNRADGGPRLADAAGPGQGDEPHIVAAHVRLDKPDLAFPPHKRRSRRRHGADFDVALDRQGDDRGQFVSRRPWRHVACHRLAPLLTTKP